MNASMLVQEEKIQLIDVAIPLPIQDPYTYQAPANFSGRIQPGCRVRVPFKNRILTGFVVGVDSGRAVAHPKKVLEVLDQEPILTDHLLRLANWISENYFSSWGEAISNMVPKFLKKSGVPVMVPAPAGTGFVPIDPSKNLSHSRTGTDKARNIRLNEEQEQAFLKIKTRMSENQFSEIFIFGVTGGGKSELYVRAIKEALNHGKSAICLVPEIAITEQIEHFFIHHFHGQLEILHSKLTDRDRTQAWHRIWRGERSVILGARSAVFAPVPHLGLIIMDEEQEGSYKQDQAPRYHTREVARWRTQDLGAVFIMGTATPTLETMYRASLGEVELLTLTKRVDGRPMPEVKIVDLKQAQEINKRPVIISSHLQAAIEHALEIKSGVLLMLNRRGFSTHIQCFQCAHVLFCSHCAVALTFHQDEQQAICHYCNYHTAIPSLCTQCGHPLFKFSGIGTEKVESEVARLFPKARIARLDTDSTRKRGSHEQILTRFRAGEIDILIGTQMIAKGFDFQHVTLVGIISADTGLLLPDFRSAERTFQLLVQMAGRTGRGKEKGTVLIQTYSPNHYSIQFAAKHDYSGFFSEEIERRRTLFYPPFTKLINLIFRGKKEEEVREQAHQFRKLLESHNDHANIELIGPAPLPLYRLRGHYRWHLMLRGSRLESLKRMVEKSLGGFKRKKGVYLAIDSEPVTIL